MELRLTEDFTVILDGRSSPSPVSLADPLIGHVIDEKYEILRLIAVGGMGKVYLARRRHIGDEVVVKLLEKKYLADERASERFRREAQAAARIHHPNVVAVHDFGEAQSGEMPAYIVMEFVAGVSLGDVLLKESKLSLARTIRIMREICRGVGAGHHNGVIHRDIKPSNIMVFIDDEGHETVKVVDFGLAKLRDETENPVITQVGVIVGTPAYMSPEQCRGERLSTRSDVYSLGVITYEMLTGKVPFGVRSTALTVQKHQHEAPPSFPVDLKIPEAVESVVFRALAKDPNARQKDAASYSRELQAADISLSRTPLAEMNSTEHDGEDIARSPNEAPLNMGNGRLFVLGWAGHRATEHGRVENEKTEDIFEAASMEGVAREACRQALKVLLDEGLIQGSGAPTNEGLFSYYSLTPAGFDKYGTALIDNYRSIKRNLLSHVSQGDLDDSLSLANATKQPRILVDQILELLSQKNLITVKKRLGGKVVINEISSDLETAEV